MDPATGNVADPCQAIICREICPQRISSRPIQQMRGYLQGPNTFDREGDRLSRR